MLATPIVQGIVTLTGCAMVPSEPVLVNNSKLKSSHPLALETALVHWPLLHCEAAINVNSESNIDSEEMVDEAVQINSTTPLLPCKSTSIIHNGALPLEFSLAAELSEIQSISHRPSTHFEPAIKINTESSCDDEEMVDELFQIEF